MADVENGQERARIIDEAQTFLLTCDAYEPGDPELYDALEHGCEVIRRLLRLVGP